MWTVVGQGQYLGNGRCGVDGLDVMNDALLGIHYGIMTPHSLAEEVVFEPHHCAATKLVEDDIQDVQ